MKPIYIIFLIIILLPQLALGCTGKTKIQEAPKNPQGWAEPQPPIDPNVRGNEYIEITPELTYPGMENAPGMHYEFFSKDAPEIVAKWYESSLEGSNVRKTNADVETNTQWIITWKDLTITVSFNNETESMIKFSRET